ncbi:MAG: hypothetical protein UZ18_ATM001001610 [Armatimonadetes bacterium OLB18]|nr:MAG: hypothetical protein UZ18_ATM001001610 [Armatimonadetes bacterium OLB18]
MLAFIAAAGLLPPNPPMESIERPTRTSEALALDSSGRYALRSPSGSLDVQIELPQGSSAGRPLWSLQRGTKTLLDGCLLSLTEKARGDLMEGARVESVATRFVDERVPILFGKSSEGVNRFREIRLGLRTPTGAALRSSFAASTTRWRFDMRSSRFPVRKAWSCRVRTRASCQRGNGRPMRATWQISLTRVSISSRRFHSAASGKEYFSILL